MEEIYVCENHKLLTGKEGCRKCHGFECRYLQSISANLLIKYLEKGYRWSRK